MSLRLVEILVPQSADDDVRELLANVDVVAAWHEPALDGQRLARVLLRTEKVEPVLDLLERRFGLVDGFRVVLLPVEATLPRPADPPAEPAARIARQELVADLVGGAKVTRVYVATVILSAVVTAVGLIQDSVAVIIGAMVIAPLLTPNMALALATTLGDLVLARKALRTNAVGVVIAFLFALAVGALLTVDPSTPEIVARTRVSHLDVVLGLAAGSAGALAFTTGVPAGLVGVMVAVALMPPLIVAGLLLASGRAAPAANALLLLAINVICVNLAGVVTFLLQGVRPRTWWEADKARRATRWAVGLWSALLAVLVVVLFLAVGG